MNGTRGGRKKLRHQQVVRTTISLNPRVHDALLDLTRRFGFNGISDYFDDRIRADAGLNTFMEPPKMAAK